MTAAADKATNRQRLDTWSNDSRTPPLAFRRLCELSAVSRASFASRLPIILRYANCFRAPHRHPTIGNSLISTSKAVRNILGNILDVRLAWVNTGNSVGDFTYRLIRRFFATDARRRRLSVSAGFWIERTADSPVLDLASGDHLQARDGRFEVGSRRCGFGGRVRSLPARVRHHSLRRNSGRSLAAV